MPLYEFNCKKCGHSFEELLTMAEADGAKLACPACGAKGVEKGFSAFATSSGSSAGFAGGGGCSGGGCGSGGFT